MSQRIHSVDAVRAMALFGILMAHAHNRFNLYVAEHASCSTDYIYDWLNDNIFVCKSFMVFAFLFGIAPNLVTVPAIMIGNAVFVALLGLTKKAAAQWQKIGLYLLAAVGKFGVLYVLVTYVICGVLAEELIAQGLLKAPMLNVLPASFALPQLITALIGGALALVTAPRIPLAHRPDRK